jgi:hypothetical protein
MGVHILVTAFLSLDGGHIRRTKGQPASQMAGENREKVFLVMPTKFYIYYICLQSP